MTIKEFRAHKYLPAEWAKLLRTNAILQRVLIVMEENHPSRFVVIGDANDDVSPTRAAIELGTTRGYSKYGDTLKLLAEPLKAAQQLPEPTYEKEEIQEQR